jgi:hypothetical protein
LWICAALVAMAAAIFLTAPPFPGRQAPRTV